MTDSAPHAHVFVIFGATGDLTHRKLLPLTTDISELAIYGWRVLPLPCGESSRPHLIANREYREGTCGTRVELEADFQQRG